MVFQCIYNNQNAIFGQSNDVSNNTNTMINGLSNVSHNNNQNAIFGQSNDVNNNTNTMVSGLSNVSHNNNQMLYSTIQ